jgi:ABC-type multidrug transport system ATPase subunit
MQILKELNEVDKKTVVLVTHNAEHLHYADRIIYIKDGKLVKEEVNKEKRSEGGRSSGEVGKMPDVKYNELSNELKLLMRTFKNLSLSQVGSLLVPFKASQLMSHVLSDISQEQQQTAGAYLKEFLFENIDMSALKKNLDLDYEKGGAGWNKQRVRSFIDRIESITKMSKIVSEKQDENAVKALSEYLINSFKLHLDEDVKRRLESVLEQRIKNKIDRPELQKELDARKVLGGVGLYSNTAEKISREVEIIMLMKYSTY